MDIIALILMVVLLLMFVWQVLTTSMSLAGMLLGLFLPLSQKYRSILDKNFGYYQALPVGHKREFEKRAKNFMEDKDFFGKGIPVTDEMRVLISAAAVQLTMGLPDLLLIHFTKVFVFPDQYYSGRSRQDHLGEVNPGFRSITLSWKHFTDGYEDCCDGRNLGLHEMAHALWLEDTRLVNVEDDFFEPKVLARWKDLAQEEVSQMKAGKSGFFRKYAMTNQAEFFSVAVEYFFEQPNDYKEELPELYGTMCELLGQDPAKA